MRMKLKRKKFCKGIPSSLWNTITEKKNFDAEEEAIKSGFLFLTFTYFNFKIVFKIKAIRRNQGIDMIDIACIV